MGAKFDYKEFERFAQKFKAQAPKVKDSLKTAIKQGGEAFKSAVKGNTPVDSGDLRGAWALGKQTATSIDVDNNMEYASYVEEGHRTRGGGGYVPGQFFMKKTVDSHGSKFTQTVGDKFKEEVSKLME